VNPWAFSLLKYWLKAVLVPINRNYSVVDNIIDSAGKKLSRYFRQDIKLVMDEPDKDDIQRIKNGNRKKDSLRLPQISIDSSGFVMTRPDSFLPKCDIIRGEDYVIFMDVPGVQESDVSVTRQNVITIVKGVRKKSLFEENLETNYETKERYS
jgi:HSP20 family molecular chaperone IbpA